MRVAGFALIGALLFGGIASAQSPMKLYVKTETVTDAAEVVFTVIDNGADGTDAAFNAWSINIINNSTTAGDTVYCVVRANGGDAVDDADGIPVKYNETLRIAPEQPWNKKWNIGSVRCIAATAKSVSVTVVGLGQN